MALNTHRQYSINNNSIAKSTEKLSSGYRINRAGDDAAGLAISEKMRAQIRGLNMAAKNSNDAISLVQTAEGALTETHAILQRMRELAVQAASDTNDDEVDRIALDAEFQQLKEEIDDIAEKTTFNGKKLLDGSFGGSTSTSPSVTINGTGSALKGGITVSDIVINAEEFEAGKSYTIDFSVIEDSGNPGTYTCEVTLSSDGSTIDTKPFTINAGKIELDFGSDSEPDVTISTSATVDQLHEMKLVFSVSAGSTSAGSAAKIQTGANAGETLEISIASMASEALGSVKVDENGQIDEANGSELKLSDSLIDTQQNASKAITVVSKAINDVSSQRAKLGAYQNRLEHKINNLETSAENLTAAESRIRDIDMAKEMTEFTKNNILVQASTAMLAQANQAPQNVLALLK